MNEIKKLIKEQDLNERITQIAKQIEKDFENEEIILVCILKGAVYFIVDLSNNTHIFKVFGFLLFK